jgi:hypothetical protein
MDSAQEQDFDAHQTPVRHSFHFGIEEIIAQSSRRLIGLANDILRQEPSDESQSGALSRALAAFAATIQLDRSTLGP